MCKSIQLQLDKQHFVYAKTQQRNIMKLLRLTRNNEKAIRIRIAFLLFFEKNILEITIPILPTIKNNTALIIIDTSGKSRRNSFLSLRLIRLSQHTIFHSYFYSVQAKLQIMHISSIITIPKH